MKLMPFSLLLLSGCFFAGCQSFIDNPHFIVKDSGLNWVTIRHYNYRITPIQRVNLRIDGNGMVTIREGTSLLVTNPYAIDHNEPTWQDCRERRLILPKEDVRPIFQMLVDQGLFKPRQKGSVLSTNEAIFVSANIQNKTCGDENDVYGNDPDLAESLKNVVLMFAQPQPKRKP